MKTAAGYQKRSKGVDPVTLRRHAEIHLRQQRKSGQTRSMDGKSGGDAVRILHELEVHQVELELQNAELQKARNELELTVEKYTDLYDCAPVGYFSIDESGRILEANLTGAALLGIERSRLINRSLLVFMPAASRPVLLAFLKAVFTGTGKKICEAMVFKENAPDFLASFHGVPTASAGPRRWCRVAISDITLLKQAEGLLRRNEALFSALIDQSPIGMYVVDEKLCLHQVNLRAQPVFSKIHPLIGRSLSEILHIFWPKKIAATQLGHFRKTLRTGEPYYSPAFSEQRRDLGVTESYEWQLQRITLGSGLPGVVCFFNDITERKRAEASQRRIDVLGASNEHLKGEIRQRVELEKSLKRSKQQQGQLLAQSRLMEKQLRSLSRQLLLAQEEERKRISRELHDVIAQTLTGINVRLAALKKDAQIDTASLDDNIARTQELVEKSVDLVHQFARELRPTVLDDLGLIPALHTFLKHFSKDTGIRVSLSAFAGIEQISGEKRTVLFRVAQEALINVNRHAHATRVEVKIQSLPDGVAMEIKDNGRGFEAGSALNPRRSKRLGLLGMRERMEMVHGTFTIKSTPGKGTTVCAQIPFEPVTGRKPRAESRLQE